MPARVPLGQVVTVEVRLTQGRLLFSSGAASDEQVIVVDPKLPLAVTIICNGFVTVDQRRGAKRGTRSMRLPALGKPEAHVGFRVRAARIGRGEVQVIVRQDDPQPLASLRLGSEIVSGDGVEPPALLGQLTGDREEQQALVEPGARFLSDKVLVIDENVVGAVSRLTFELVLRDERQGCRVRHIPEVRMIHERIIDDKPTMLKDLFTKIDKMWKDLHNVAPPIERSRQFLSRLQSVGDRLARDVLPEELRTYLEQRPDSFDELTIITSGETDIPWELVYIRERGRGDDTEGHGFLGRAGLVRWLYNTRHPRRLTVRPGTARYLIPAYTDQNLKLVNAQNERDDLKPFRATPITPPDGEELARLLNHGQIDLLHFAGHGRVDDAADPPVQEMLLADYRPPPQSTGGADAHAAGRTSMAFSLGELRASLPERPMVLPEPGPFVVLNACRLGAAPSHRSEAGGFAEAFLRGGAGVFVGCLWSVGDEPARVFIRAFYAALANGMTIAKATVEARTVARRAGDHSWLAYTVYAHPDARFVKGLRRSKTKNLNQPARSNERGTSMTTTPAEWTSRGVTDLTSDNLRALHPYVVDVPDGKLAEGDPSLPTAVADLRTTEADVRAIFEEHLPRFIQSRKTPVPLVIWAHGGLVGKASGLRVAHDQIDWWKVNGAFPVHFIWETGLAESIWDAVKDSLPGRARGFDLDWLIEAAVRGGQGAAVWGAMKTTAELASEKKTGGAWFFAQQLAAYVKANPGKITVHTIGHSAGSIFHSYLIPELLAAGVPTISSLNLLAPAVRVELFKDRLLKQKVRDHIERFTLFTMSEHFEKDDTCIGVYRKSLLYLIRAALEDVTDAKILGLQECVFEDNELSGLFGAPMPRSRGEVMWSRTVGGGLRSSSQSVSHGGFDNDRDTMNSLARRILDTDNLTKEWAGSRALGDELWPSQEEAFAYIDDRQAANATKTAGPRKRALCIGIDSYPAGDQLFGCVEDAKSWREALGAAGFDVELLTNDKATRENMVERIQSLVVTSRPGDVLVLQYAGHGTTVVDLNKDEAEEDKGAVELRDEAICPVDFRDGNLLIDDDLGELWDQLPEGVSLTIFFDSCFSGGGQRNLIEPPSTPEEVRRPRLVALDSDTETAYRERRGHTNPVKVSRDDERGVFFGACLSTEVAWETGSHGDFTSIAIPLLHKALEASSSNKQFFEELLRAFGSARRQTPVLRPPRLEARGLLVAVDSETAATDQPLPLEATQALVPTPAPISNGSGDGEGPKRAATVSRREQAVVSILRGVADLIES